MRWWLATIAKLVLDSFVLEILDRLRAWSIRRQDAAESEGSISDRRTQGKGSEPTSCIPESAPASSVDHKDDRREQRENDGERLQPAELGGWYAEIDLYDRPLRVQEEVAEGQQHPTKVSSVLWDLTRGDSRWSGRPVAVGLCDRRADRSMCRG